MKQTLLSIISLFLLLQVNGQSPISISPANYQQTFTVDLEEAFLIQDPTITITNNTDSTISLRWERFVLDQPEGWQTQVCDPNECYFPQVNSNVDDGLGIDAPVVIGPGDSTKISLYILPNEIAGSGMFALDLAMVNQPDSILASPTFDLEVASVVTSTIDQMRNQEFVLYPNPTVDYFQVTNSEDIDRVAIYNLVGNKVKEYRAAPGAYYDLFNLPNGLYLVTLINDDLGAIKTMRLGKRTFRP